MTCCVTDIYHTVRLLWYLLCDFGIVNCVTDAGYPMLHKSMFYDIHDHGYRMSRVNNAVYPVGYLVHGHCSMRKDDILWIGPCSVRKDDILYICTL